MISISKDEKKHDPLFVIATVIALLIFGYRVFTDVDLDMSLFEGAVYLCNSIMWGTLAYFIVSMIVTIYKVKGIPLLSGKYLIDLAEIILVGSIYVYTLIGLDLLWLMSRPIDLLIQYGVVFGALLTHWIYLSFKRKYIESGNGSSL